MKPAVVFQLYGPLSSWGCVEGGSSVRPTTDHPTKSAVCGIVGACMGMSRDDTDMLSQLAAMPFACAVVSPGRLMADYHTVAVSKMKLKKGDDAPVTRAEELALMTGDVMLTSRHYLADAMFVVALQGDMAPTIAAALQRPRFQPFLGRKSCLPTIPFAPVVVDGPDVAQAFRNRSIVLANNPAFRRLDIDDEAVVYFDDGFPGLKAESRSTRHDYPIDFTRALGRSRARIEAQTIISLKSGGTR